MKIYYIFFSSVIVIILSSCAALGETVTATIRTNPVVLQTKEITLYSTSPCPTIDKCAPINGDGTKPSGRLLYTINQENGNADIFLIDITDKSKYQITNNPASDYSPVISRDKTQIAFLSDRSERFKYGLYILDLTKLNLNKSLDEVVRTRPLMVNNNIEIRGARWSPSGQWISFITVMNNSNRYVELINTENNNRKQLLNQIQYNHSAVWSPVRDNLFIVNSIDAVQSCGSIIQKATVDQVINNLPPEEYFFESCIFLDGGISINDREEILLTEEIDATIGIYKYDLGEKKIYPVVNSEGVVSWAPSWSPDGKWMGYFSKERDSEGKGIYIYNFINKTSSIVFKSTGQYISSWEWSPDSNYVAYTMKTMDNKYYIEIISIDSILKKELGCTTKPMRLGPFDGTGLVIYEWIQ